MSGLFGGANQGPTRINAVQINQSVLGYAVPVVMGRGKVQQSILWTDGFASKKVDTSGGKGFGGKAGNQYVYRADVIAALCYGGPTGLRGIGDVWSGQSWLSNVYGVESYTIGGSSPVYTPTNASSATGDQGVGYAVPITELYNDLGAPAPTGLATSLNVAFQWQPFGTALSSGQYSIDPATNDYHFSTADAGVTVQISYTFALGHVKRQVNAVISSSLQVVVPVDSTDTYQADAGVVYYTTDGSDPNDGHALTFVSGTPTTAGTYGRSGSSPRTYLFAAGDIHKEVQITYAVNVTHSLPAGTQHSLSFMLLGGLPGQEPWALLLTNFPSAAVGYTNIALVCYAPMDLGYGAQIQQNVFDVLTADAWGSGISDCNPVQCILQVLSNPVWGLGAGTAPFPISAIDNGPNGTWGSGNAANGGNGASAMANRASMAYPVGGPAPRTPISEGTATAWFAANNFFISPVLDRQDSAASAISRWLEAGQCAAFMSEGLLKLVPFGDTSAAANGATWTAPSAYAALLDDTDFVSNGEEPVKISAPVDYTSAWNTVQVSWNNRANQYAPEITPESDKAAINRYGSRIEDPQAWDFITTLPAATFAASMRVKRSVYLRNQYKFKLPFWFGYLEPMDIVAITTGNPWSTENPIALVQHPARITKIVDNPDGTYDVTCEDYIWGIHQPSAYNKNTAAGAVQANQYADPGNTEAVVFEAPSRLTGYKGNQLWIGAAGAIEDWGGCNVLASVDGTKYTTIGTIETAARLGAIGAALSSGADPDTTDSLIINLVPGSVGLESGTTADADQNNTLCYVDGELISYSACAATAADQYTADTYIRRGQMGSAVAAHASGAPFMRLDSAVMQYTYDPSWAGKTVYLKFQSFNRFGNSVQDPSTLTAAMLTIPGLNPGAFDAATGFALNVGGVPGPTIVQGLVNAGAIAPGTYGGTTHHQLTVSPTVTTVNPPNPISFTAFLDGTATTAVTWSVTNSSEGSIDSSGNYTPPSSPGLHGGTGVLATLIADSTVVGGASISW
jgi:hypothetical protein